MIVLRKILEMTKEYIFLLIIIRKRQFVADRKTVISMEGYLYNFKKQTNAKKIIDNLKHADSLINDKVMTLTIINNFLKKNYSNRDPISLIEDISVKLFSLITKNALDKYMPELINKKLYLDLLNTEEFNSIKESVGELQKVNLNSIISNPNTSLCFWLNAFNFLTIFTIIYKKEILINNYEWYRFLKSSNFNIGGYEFSLYEIEYCIIKYSHN